jgi:hypothetical protein
MKESEMSDSKPKANEADWGFGALDFAKLIESFQISGVDMKSLIDMEKKNIDALVEVNRSAYDSWQSLMARQAEVFPGNDEGDRRRGKQRNRSGTAH